MTEETCPPLISGVQSTDFSRVFFVWRENTQLKLVLYTPSNQETTWAGSSVVPNPVNRVNSVNSYFGFRRNSKHATHFRFCACSSHYHFRSHRVFVSGWPDRYFPRRGRRRRVRARLDEEN